MQRALSVAVVAVVLSCLPAFADNTVPLGTLADNSGTDAQQSLPIERVIARDADHCTKETLTFRTNSESHVAVRTNHFTTVSPGMSVLQQDGSYAPANTIIEVQPDGTAAALQTRHKVYFRSDITDVNGPIRFVGSDLENTTFVARPLCISYYDRATGQSVLIGEFRSTVGTVALGDSKIVYPDCCADFKCNLIIQNTFAGIESFLEISEAPPPPSVFGLGENSDLELITEFLSAPQPQKTTVTNNNVIDEAALSWGSFRMPRGKAFKVGNSRSVPVRKKWTTMEGRQVLIENIDYRLAKSALNSLPQPNHASLAPKQTSRHVASISRELPKRIASVKPGDHKIQIAAAPLQSSGYLLDYSIVTTTTNGFTFEAGKTYVITNAVYISGYTSGQHPTIFEGNSVIKFANNSDASINFFTTDFHSGPYRPVVFTSVNDDTVGDVVSGSTGDPSSDYCGDVALHSAYVTSPTLTIHDCRFSHLNDIFSEDYSDGALITVQDFQAVNCSSFLETGDGTTINAYNGLLWNIGAVFDNPSHSGGDEQFITGINLTFHNCDHFQINTKQDVALTNCLLVNVTNFDSDTSWLGYTTNAVVILADDTGVFTNFGGGLHYLADNTYRGIGITNVPASLLAGLRKKTTFPPDDLTELPALHEVNILDPVASRDTGSNVSLGFHYDPIDYVFDLSISADVLLTNGTVVAFHPPSEGDAACYIDSDAQFFSRGSPNIPNWITWYNTVQETIWDGWGNNSGDMFELVSSGSLWDCRFTHFSALAGSGAYMSAAGANYEGDTRLRDCEFFGGTVDCWPWSGSYTFTNCLFDHCAVWATANDYITRSLAFQNCVFHKNFIYLNATTHYPITFTNCFFDTTNISQLTTNIAADYNGYLTNNTHRLTNTHDTVLAMTNFPYATGQLGTFYHGTNSLQDVGNATAAQLGLFHYTVLTNQIKETNSVVDIGYHYVALAANQVPLDTNNDGVPDYAEDANGNGVIDSGESNWRSNSPPSIAGPTWLQVPVDVSLAITSITVADLDDAGGVEQISLNVSNGILNLGSTTGLSFISGTNGMTTNLAFQGTLTNLNAALHSLSYRTSLHFFGNDTLVVVADDLGNTGPGGAKTNRVSIPFDIGFHHRIPIAAGSDHSLFLNADGTVLAWGGNLGGQLGDGTFTSRSATEPVIGLSNTVYIGASEWLSFALQRDGTLFGWGQNPTGQLGNGATGNAAYPSTVHLTNVVAFGIGENHVLAETSDGDVWTWGSNTHGQLGNGASDFTAHSTPALISGIVNPLDLAGGASHSLAIASNGAVYAWGDNSNGQLGDGTYTSHSSPVALSTMTNAAQVQGSLSSSYARTVDGRVFAWGKNDDGELGNGSNDTTNAPTQVSGLSNVISIAACPVGYCCFALCNDGTVWAWGFNDNGDLGNGSYASSNVPIQVSGLSNIVAIAAGADFGEAVDANGKVWGWGGNFSSQLRHPGLSYTNAPTQIDLNYYDGALPSLIILDGNNQVFDENNTLAALSVLPIPATLLVTNSAGTPLSGAPITFAVTQGNVLIAASTNGTPTNVLSLRTDSLGRVEAWIFVPAQNNSTNQITATATTSTSSVSVVFTEFTFDYYNGTLPNLSIVSGNHQSAETNSFLSEPLVVRVTDTNSIPITNAPIAFATTTGDAEVALGTEDEISPSVVSRTDTNGYALVWVYITDPSVTNVISATAISGTNHTSVSFYVDVYTNAPQFSVYGGTFLLPLPVQITYPVTNATIYYTTNGVIPTNTDTLITSGSSVTVNHDLILMARAFATNLVPSGVRSAQFFFEDTAGDGVPDYIKIDNAIDLVSPVYWTPPGSNPTDHTAPTITLDEPVEATLIP